MSSTAAKSPQSGAAWSSFADFVRALDVPICNAVKSGDDALASGGFADVWKGHLNSDVESLVAIKIIRGTFSDDLMSKVYRRLASEVKIWSQLKHPNVLKLHGISLQEGKRIWLVSPWMEKGSLRDYLEKNPKADRLRLIRQFVEGVQYLHEKGVVHGDIKTANVLVDRSGQAVLADFGLSRVVEDALPQQTTSTLSHGSLAWMAPERMEPEKFGLTARQAYSHASDVYSVGMTIYEVVSSKLPFDDLPNIFVIHRTVLEGGRPPHPGDSAKRNGLSNRLWAFVKECWEIEPKKRPILSDAVNTVLRQTSLVSVAADTCIAEQNYEAQHWKEIDLWKGRIVYEVREESQGLSYGMNILGHWGWFPSDYVRLLDRQPIGGKWNERNAEDERDRTPKHDKSDREKEAISASEDSGSECSIESVTRRVFDSRESSKHQIIQAASPGDTIPQDVQKGPVASSYELTTTLRPRSAPNVDNTASHRDGEPRSEGGAQPDRSSMGTSPTRLSLSDKPTLGSTLYSRPETDIPAAPTNRPLPPLPDGNRNSDLPRPNSVRAAQAESLPALLSSHQAPFLRQPSGEKPLGESVPAGARNQQPLSHDYAYANNTRSPNQRSTSDQNMGSSYVPAATPPAWQYTNVLNTLSNHGKDFHPEGDPQPVRPPLSTSPTWPRLSEKAQSSSSIHSLDETVTSIAPNPRPSADSNINNELRSPTIVQTAHSGPSPDDSLPHQHRQPLFHDYAEDEGTHSRNGVSTFEDRTNKSSISWPASQPPIIGNTAIEPKASLRSETGSSFLPNADQDYPDDGTNTPNKRKNSDGEYQEVWAALESQVVDEWAKELERRPVSDEPVPIDVVSWSSSPRLRSESPDKTVDPPQPILTTDSGSSLQSQPAPLSTERRESPTSRIVDDRESHEGSSSHSEPLLEVTFRRGPPSDDLRALQSGPVRMSSSSPQLLPTQPGRELRRTSDSNVHDAPTPGTANLSSFGVAPQRSQDSVVDFILSDGLRTLQSRGAGVSAFPSQLGPQHSGGEPKRTSDSYMPNTPTPGTTNFSAFVVAPQRSQDSVVDSIPRGLHGQSSGDLSDSNPPRERSTLPSPPTSPDYFQSRPLRESTRGPLRRPAAPSAVLSSYKPQGPVASPISRQLHNPPIRNIPSTDAAEPVPLPSLAPSFVPPLRHPGGFRSFDSRASELVPLPSPAPSSSSPLQPFRSLAPLSSGAGEGVLLSPSSHHQAPSSLLRPLPLPFAGKPAETLDHLQDTTEARSRPFEESKQYDLLYLSQTGAMEGADPRRPSQPYKRESPADKNADGFLHRPLEATARSDFWVSAPPPPGPGINPRIGSAVTGNPRGTLYPDTRENV